MFLTFTNTLVYIQIKGIWLAKYNVTSSYYYANILKQPNFYYLLISWGRHSYMATNGK
jgi:hypothetical protein